MALNLIMNNQPIVELIQLSIADRLVNITESVVAGEQVHLLGANGAGKSTLLCAMSGFLAFTGQLKINGKNVRDFHPKDLGQLRTYFPQQVTTQPILKVFQYLALFHASSVYQLSLFDELCQDFQLEKLLLKPITQLSGGEWQRVRIIAIFLQVWNSENLSGKFILFDEPTNNLDIIQQAKLDKWVKYFCDCQGTVIMSGHNLSHSYKCASRIWMMKNGKIIFSGIPDKIMTDFNLSEIFASEIRLSTNDENKAWQVINFDD